MNYFPKMHVSLYVSDINKTVDFYTQFFGQAPSKTKDDYAKFILDKPSLIISFVKNKERVQSNFGHLGFQVESEQALTTKLLEVQSKRLDTREEMGTNCCYATQDKFWVADPDGHQWEVYYFHEDAEFNDPKYVVQEQSACCTPSPDKKKVKIDEVVTETSCCEPDSDCC